ncbi:hypothetical protein BDN72DRAFT_958639 [Pluteus cervinus]|uniref:Uncharacterized protein n=1 Tax=Pluteus cervinus TaxID=181527 RepID=A0ACD3AY60_9AGAR|nr:hypothetical protein BDN72DRAFT_958639 [Pluteus cervinus]
MSRFPAEIIEQFILHINEDEGRINNLHSCSLVSQTWGTISQRFLFSQVTLNGPRKAQSLAVILSKSPHIQGYIHHLVITNEYNLATIITILSTLSSLKSLQLRVHRRYAPTSLARELCQHHIPSSSTLTSLQLSNLIDFPVQFLFRWASLRHLSLKYVTFSTSDSAGDAKVIDSPLGGQFALKSLILWTSRTGGDSWLISPHCPFDFSQLDRFIGLDRSDMDSSYEAHCKFISRVSSSLKTVLIVPPKSSRMAGFGNPLGLLEPQKLWHISSVTISIFQHLGEGVNTLPWLVAFLSGLPNRETLHDLTLLCDLWGPPTGSSHLGDWCEIDALLARFHNLQRVHLKCYDEGDDNRTEICSRWLLSQFPKLNEKRILSIKFSDDQWFGEIVGRELKREFLD